VPEVLEVISTESDAQYDGDLLCDEQGDALGDDVPVRERARLPLGSPLEDNSGVLLTLAVIPDIDGNRLPDIVTVTDAHKVDTTEFEPQEVGVLLWEGQGVELGDSTSVDENALLLL
jgi:hypothetical protein